MPTLQQMRSIREHHDKKTVSKSQRANFAHTPMTLYGIEKLSLPTLK
jgi:hypothetical protein